MDSCHCAHALVDENQANHDNLTPNRGSYQACLSLSHFGFIWIVTPAKAGFLQ